LQGGINQQEWRILEVWHELYYIMVPHLSQPYQNVRDRLGSCLATVFWFDLPAMNVEKDVTAPPLRTTFLSEVNRKLKILWAEVERGVPGKLTFFISK
jgi:proteasome activator subunit 4